MKEYMTIADIVAASGAHRNTVTKKTNELYPELARKGSRKRLSYEQALVVMRALPKKNFVKPEQNSTSDLNKIVQVSDDTIKRIVSETVSSIMPIMKELVTSIYEIMKPKEIEKKPAQMLTDQTKTTLVTPTSLGTLLRPQLSAQEVNRLLEKLGYQRRVDGIWQPTMKGAKYGNVEPETFQDRYTGDMVQKMYCRWRRDIIDKLQLFIDNQSDLFND